MRRTAKNKKTSSEVFFVFSLCYKIGFEPLGSSVKKTVRGTYTCPVNITELITLTFLKRSAII